ncbi:hypothetical protein L1887_28984 [Cichorium endivia]|nr:hypothetical protein L1887_28984 [Cichorium endivia]
MLRINSERRLFNGVCNTQLCLNTGVFPTNPMKNHIRTGFLPLVLLILHRPPGTLCGFMSLIENGNSERAHEVMRCMVRNLAEIGRLKEAVGMVIEMRNQVLEPCTQTLNCLIGVATEMGSIELARKVLVEMSERGALPDSCTFKILTISYCKSNEISHVDKWLTAMLDKGFLLCNMYTSCLYFL